jgi:hypothetical protein
MDKENSIVLVEDEYFFILILSDEEEKERAFKEISEGGVVNYGISFPISQETYEMLKVNNYTIMEV